MPFKFDIIASRLRELAFLNEGLSIDLIDHRRDKTVTFFYKGGLSQFVEYLNEDKTPLFKKPIHFTGNKEDVGVEIAVRTIKAVRPYCDGVHIMAIEWEDAVPQIVEEAKLFPRPQV